MDEQLTRDFLADADERIEALFGDIRDLHARHGEGSARRELVARIFRHVHTIKGSAAAAGVEGVVELAHEFETLLDGIRAGRVKIYQQTLEAFESAVEALAASVGAAARGQRLDQTNLVARLRKLADSHDKKSANEAALAALPADVFASLGAPERQRITEAVAEGSHLFIVAANFGLNDFDERVRALCGALSQTGEVISTLPDVSPDAPELIRFLIPFLTRDARDKILEIIEPFGATLYAESKEKDESVAVETSGADGDARFTDDTSDSPTSSPALSRLTMLVRVPLEELDDVISETHTLYNETGRALNLALESIEIEETHAKLEAQIQPLLRRFSELEERLIGMRMVSVRPMLERAMRAGVSAARAAGREVDFETRGSDVRLDKSLVEAVSDSLLHLVRNAVDHGIEPPEERRARGKPARGRIDIEALAEEGHVLLRVMDDGHGIDPQSVAHTARARGHLRADETLTEQQALRFIFRPGFSTARNLSTVSGRGVGLDIVERAVEELGGEMRLWSRKGVGASFAMRLPTTLALVTSLIVRAGDERYCIAAAHVEDVLDAKDSELKAEEMSVMWRGAKLPLVSLGALVGINAPVESANDAAMIVVADKAAHDADERSARAAIVVNSIEERGEVLVRNLGRHAARWQGVSGATELRDGSIALVLDLPRLIEMHF